VRDCTCSVNVLTKLRIEQFASWARAYIECTYHHLEQQQQEHGETAAAANEVQNNPVVAPKQELIYTQKNLNQLYRF
jgi:hypothetical protein